MQKNPITPEGAASAQNPLPPVPTTKILAISHFMGTPMTPAQRAQIMPREVHDTVNAYLAGKIDQWYFRTDGKGVVFIVNASTPEEALLAWLRRLVEVDQHGVRLRAVEAAVEEL